MAAVSSMLTGCAVSIGGGKITEDQVAKGVVYHLPLTQLRMDANFELVECGEKPDVRITGITYSTAVVSDTRPQSTFTIDPKKLQTLMAKIPKADIALNENRLETIDFEAKDGTGEVLEGVVDIVALAKGIPIKNLSTEIKGDSSNVVAFNEATQACSEQALNALAKKKAIEKRLGALRERYASHGDSISDGYVKSPYGQINEAHIAQLRKDYLKAVADYAGGVDKASDRATDIATQLNTMETALASREKAWLEGRNSALDALSKEISELEAAYEKASVALRAKAEISWAPTDEPKSKELQFDVVDLQKWYREAMGPGSWAEQNKIQLMTSCKRDAATPPASTEIGYASSIYYRIPKNCEIGIYSSGTLISSIEVPLAQYGYLGALDLENGAFQESTYGLRFTDGRLVSFNFKTDKVVAREFLAAVESGKQTLQYTKDERLRDEQERYNLMKDVLSAQKNYLEMQKQVLQEVEALRQLREELEAKK